MDGQLLMKALPRAGRFTDLSLSIISGLPQRKDSQHGGVQATFVGINQVPKSVQRRRRAGEGGQLALSAPLKRPLSHSVSRRCLFSLMGELGLRDLVL